MEMIKTGFAIVICAVVFSTCQGQSTNYKLIQNTLIHSLQNDTLINTFYLCDDDCASVNIFDLNNNIPEFESDNKVCNKRLVFYNTTSMDHPAPNSIVVYRVDVEDNNIHLYFTQPYSGAAVVFSYTYSSSKDFISSGIEVGAF